MLIHIILNLDSNLLGLSMCHCKQEQITEVYFNLALESKM